MTAWMVDGLCNDPRIDADQWFPNSRLPDAGQEAIAICQDCPVRVECRDYAMADRSLVGIWGGTTEEQRASARRKQQRARQQEALTAAEEVEAEALGVLADAVLDGVEVRAFERRAA